MRDSGHSFEPSTGSFSFASIYVIIYNILSIRVKFEICIHDSYVHNMNFTWSQEPNGVTKATLYEYGLYTINSTGEYDFFFFFK